MSRTRFTREASGKILKVEREFNAPIAEVWNAWTDSKILDEWWAPKPWKAVTKEMDFRNGGTWLYCMQGPEGEQNWSKSVFGDIVNEKSFEALVCFCDEEGNQDNTMPSMNWKVRFSTSEAGTLVEVDIEFDSVEDIEKIVGMGFKEGFTMAQDNLDELL